MSKSDTNKKWVSTDEYKSNYDRIFNKPKCTKDEVFFWGGSDYQDDECDCSGAHYNSEDGYVTCSMCGDIRGTVSNVCNYKTWKSVK